MLDRRGVVSFQLMVQVLEVLNNSLTLSVHIHYFNRHFASAHLFDAHRSVISPLRPFCHTLELDLRHGQAQRRQLSPLSENVWDMMLIGLRL